MPKNSPFVVDLSVQERHELEARARRYTSPYRDVVRARNLAALMAQLDRYQNA
jgi:hypothetical protein